MGEVEGREGEGKGEKEGRGREGEGRGEGRGRGREREGDEVYHNIHVAANCSARKGRWLTNTLPPVMFLTWSTMCLAQ